MGPTLVLPNARADQWRGCGGSTTTNTAAALKCGVQIDLLTGALTALDLADGRTHDRALPCQHITPPVGSLRLADLGFYAMHRLAELDAAGVYWLSKVRSTVSITPPSQLATDLVTFVERDASAGDAGWVEIGAHQPVRARVRVQPVPDAVAEARRRRIRKEANAKGQTPSTATLQLAA